MDASPLKTGAGLGSSMAADIPLDDVGPRVEGRGART